MCEIQHHKISTSPVTFAAAATLMKKQIISSSNSSQEQVLSTNFSPTTVLVDLIDENEMPRKEKLQLIKELSEIKSLCNNIFTSFNQEK